jgi:urea transport system substrate-binding protein
MVLMTLVGTSAVRFNQTFARAGLSPSIVRFSTFLDAIGAASSANLYSSAGYFASIRTTAAKNFVVIYAKRFGTDPCSMTAIRPATKA